MKEVDADKLKELRQQWEKKTNPILVLPLNTSLFEAALGVTEIYVVARHQKGYDALHYFRISGEWQVSVDMRDQPNLDKVLGFVTREFASRMPTVHNAQLYPLNSELQDVNEAIGEVHQALGVLTQRKSELETSGDKLIEDQKKWIADHGGTLVAYIERYGKKGEKDCYGDGGQTIFMADMAELERLIAARDYKANRPKIDEK